MPEIISRPVYNNARTRFRDYIRSNRRAIIQNHIITVPRGELCFRTVPYAYNNGFPQIAEQAARIWPKGLNGNEDRYNAWNGVHADGTPGKGGLYVGRGKAAWDEIRRYTEFAAPSALNIKYLKSQVGGKPVWDTTPASDLRSHFTYSTSNQLRLLDLSLHGALIQDMGKEIITAHPKEFMNRSLAFWYNHPTDAAVTRALGNTAFEELTGDIDGHHTITRRGDMELFNMLLKGEYGEVVKALNPESRTTIFVVPDTKELKEVQTPADIKYDLSLKGITVEIDNVEDMISTLPNYSEVADELVKSMHWERAELRMETMMKKKLNETAENKEYFLKDPNKVAKDLVRDFEFRNKLKLDFEAFTLSQTQESKHFEKIMGQLGPQGLMTLALSSVTMPYWDKMQDAYLEKMMKGTVIEHQKPFLIEDFNHKGVTLLEQDELFQQTKGEIETKTEVLNEAKKQLEVTPNDERMKERVELMKWEIENLVKERQRLDAERRDVVRERDLAHDRVKLIEEEKAKTERERKELRDKIFERK